MIACNNVQLLVEVNPTKDLGAQLLAKQTKLEPKIGFFTIFSSFVHQFSLKLHRMIAWKNVSLVQVKITKKFFGVQIWFQNQSFRHFLKFASLVFFDIAQDCRLGQCLTSSRAETSKKPIPVPSSVSSIWLVFSEIAQRIHFTQGSW